MTLEEEIRSLGVNDVIRIYRTHRGVFVLRDSTGFYPKHQCSYLANGEWHPCKEGVLFDDIEPYTEGRPATLAR